MSTVQILDWQAQHLLRAARLFAKIQPELSSYLGHQLEQHIEQQSQAGFLHQPQQQSKRRDIRGPELCLACSSLQIPGLTCDIAIQRKKFKPQRKTLARTKLEASKSGNSAKARGHGESDNKVLPQGRPFGLQSSRLRTTCRICRRYIQQLLHKSDDKKQASTQRTAVPEVVATVTAVTAASKALTNGETIAVPRDKPIATSNSKITIASQNSSVAATSASVQRKARQKQKKGGLAAILAQSKAQSSKAPAASSSLAFSDFTRKT